MTGYAMITRAGGIVTAEADAVWYPIKSRGASKYGVILLHGANAPLQYSSGNTRWESPNLAAAIASAGIPCVAGTMGGNTFANDAVMGHVTAAKDYLVAETGCSPDKVHIIGASMGAGVGIRWAAQNLASVASYVGIIPQVDIDETYQSNAGGLRAAIGTAWGVTHPTPLPAGADLYAQAGVMAGVIPSRIYYAGDDTLAPPATVTEMATTIGAGVVQDIGNLGHTEQAVGAVGLLTTPKWQGLIDFLIANGA